uniref:Putative ovule protein n=1 Tax=Solanum chacoense TaxID=4108 RepID=A0A0V0HGM6_SOLCH
MQSNSSPPFPLIPLVLFNGGQLSEGGFELSRFLFLGSLLFSQGGDDGMDLSKVGEKILSSVRSARSLGLLPSSSDRPEVPERAAAAAALARVLAGLPPHQRYTLSSSSEELSSIYGSKPPGQVVEELEEEFYEEVHLLHLNKYCSHMCFCHVHSLVDHCKKSNPRKNRRKKDLGKKLTLL